MNEMDSEDEEESKPVQGQRFTLWRVPHFVFRFILHLITDFDDFSENCQKSGRQGGGQSVHRMH